MYQELEKIFREIYDKYIDRIVSLLAQMTLKKADIPHEVQSPSPQIEVSQADKEFWNNRANKFLGENTTNNLYERIDSGEIQLPENIESKEELAYKLAMSMEQTPAHVCEALGTEFKTSAQLEAGISNMTAEDFSKLSNVLNSFDDRGNYIGNNNVATSQNTISQTEHNIENETLNNTVAVEETENNNESPKQNIETPQEQEIVQETVPEQARTEEYYQQEIDSLKESENNPVSLKKSLKDALKNDSKTANEALDEYMNNQIDNNNLSYQQAEEMAYFVNHELDARDNKQIDGYIQDEELSRKELKKGLKEVNRTLEALKNNATEVSYAQNLQNGSAENTPQHVADTYSQTPQSSQFYNGMSTILDSMKNSKTPIHDVMREAIETGKLSNEQAAVMNTRYTELREEGHSVDKTLNTMQKDYTKIANFYYAQENRGNIEQNTNTTPEKQQDTKTDKSALYQKYKSDYYY